MPTGTAVEQYDGSFVFELVGMVDLDAPTSAIRHYRLHYANNCLTIHNLDYPEYDAHFNYRDGERKWQGLQTVFKRLDAEVCAHISDYQNAFTKDLDTLTKSGFEVRLEDDEPSRNILHLVHPIYHLNYQLLAPQPGQAIAREALQTLQLATKEHSQCYYDQAEILEELGAQGWEIKHHPANGTDGRIEFSYANGASFVVPTSGEFEMFDKDWVASAARNLMKNPKAVLPAVTEIQYLGASPPIRMPFTEISGLGHDPSAREASK